MLHLSAAIALIKEFEGCSLHAYQDNAGVWTIGYGCTHNVTPGMQITDEQADQRLSDDIQSMVKAILGLIDVPVDENQFSALVCLTYNIGPGNFARSTLLKKLNQNDILGAADEFLVWNKVGGKESSGLLRRRQAERALFLTPKTDEQRGMVC